MEQQLQFQGLQQQQRPEFQQNGEAERLQHQEPDKSEALSLEDEDEDEDDYCGYKPISIEQQLQFQGLEQQQRQERGEFEQNRESERLQTVKSMTNLKPSKDLTEKVAQLLQEYSKNKLNIDYLRKKMAYKHLPKKIQNVIYCLRSDFAFYQSESKAVRKMLDNKHLKDHIDSLDRLFKIQFENFVYILENCGSNTKDNILNIIFSTYNSYLKMYVHILSSICINIVEHLSEEIEKKENYDTFSQLKNIIQIHKDHIEAIFI